MIPPGKAAIEDNDLLIALPLRERENFLYHGERVTLTRDEILCEPGRRLRHVHFVVDGFVALLVEVDGHDALAVGLVGSEGMIGAPLVLGIHTSPLRARVQQSGSALRIAAADFVRVLAQAPVLERHARQYLGERLVQFAQTAACASFHVVEARLACWLLMAHDRAHADRLRLTHDRLARLLGVRRSGVSTAAGVLQARRLIRYTRGHITILDRRGLEHLACGCYEAMRGARHPLALHRGSLPYPAPLAANVESPGDTAPTPRVANANVTR